MFTDLLMGELLALVPASGHYLGLMTTNPLLVQDPLTVEVVGPTYSRQRGMALSNGTYTNTSELRWFGLPKGTVVEAIGVFDAPANGNLIYAFRVGPHSFPKGGSYRVGSGGLTANPSSFVYTPPEPPYYPQFENRINPCDGKNWWGTDGKLLPHGQTQGTGPILGSITVTGFDALTFESPTPAKTVTVYSPGGTTTSGYALVGDWRRPSDGCLVQVSHFSRTGTLNSTFTDNINVAYPSYLGAYTELVRVRIVRQIEGGWTHTEFDRGEWA